MGEASDLEEIKIEIPTPPGGWPLQFTIDGKIGKLECTYDPEPAIKHLIATFVNLQESLCFSNDDLIKYSRHAIELFFNQLPGMIEESLTNFNRDIRLQTILKFDGDGVFNIRKPADLINYIAAIAGRDRKRRMNAPSSGRRAKITVEHLRMAIILSIKREGRACQKSVAFHLGVTPRALRDWQRKRGHTSWNEVLAEYK